MVKRRLEGEPDDSLATDCGGTKWEEDPIHLYEMKGWTC